MGWIRGSEGDTGPVKVGVRASEWVLAFTLAPLLQWGEGDKVGGRVKGGAGLGVGFCVHVSTVTTMGERGWCIMGVEVWGSV